MALSLYNTNVRRKQVFIPLDVMHISMYVCGPTVYDLAHIGNARPIIVFDVLYRLLRHIYGKDSVTYVRNITDVDDKINEAARLSGKPISAITESTITAFHADISELNTLLPNFEPRATEHIDEMIEIIEELIARGHAYESKNHVMFNVPSYKDYGKLSNRNRDEMLAGARVEVAPYKKDPADFILWKPSDETQPGWESPWGIGRPGWHIECSAMSRKHLGKTIDIHGGGADLIFPHHENEIAQSQCSCPEHDFVRYWVHNGFLTVDGEKMSKSLGNFITIREALTNTPGETLRLMMLSTHYRKPLDWTQSGLRQAHEILDYCYKALWVLQDKGDASLSEDSIPDRTIKILSDDLNTPLAISEMRKVAGQLHRASTNGDKKLQARLASELLATGHFLGVLYENPRDWFQGIKASKSHSASKSRDTEILIAESEIAEKILLRKQAREKKEFAEADIIRDELANLGVILEDSPDGKTSWRRI